MRRPRLKALKGLPVAYYHCVSRVVNRDFVLGDEEKEQFVKFMRTYETLYGLRVISFCIMSNHFHILLEVPQRPGDEDLPDDGQLVARVRSCLGDKAADGLAWDLEHFRSIGATEGAEALREKWFSRMWDVSAYMKILKQRFSQWFNGRHKRRGTLWEDRFRSVLVQGECHALRAMSAYIDLNPVRAGICEDPRDYRWCGYAEAVAGGASGRASRDAVAWLGSLAPHGGMLDEARRPKTAKESLRRWRCFLFGLPESAGRQAEELAKGDAAALRKRVPRKKALEILANGGRLSSSDYLRCRVRYFTDGAVLGTREFVESVFESARERFSEKRKTGARPLRGLEVEAKPERLFNLRQLQRNVFG